jgi:hypothetical protein
MKRRLLNLLTALSLLLCFAAAAAWVWSYWFFDGYCWFDPAQRRYFQVGNLDGRLWFHRTAVTPAAFNPMTGYFQLRIDGGGTVPGPSHVGFFLDHPARGLWTFAVPYWAIVLVSGTTAAAGVGRLVRSRRRPGTCNRCGYDLRATPDRCPECGHTATGATA